MLFCLSDYGLCKLTEYIYNILYINNGENVKAVFSKFTLFRSKIVYLFKVAQKNSFPHFSKK